MNTSSFPAYPLDIETLLSLGYRKLGKARTEEGARRKRDNALAARKARTAVFRQEGARWVVLGWG